jgi:hypothetical protein
MEEIWKDIIGYEGLYMISNIGRIMAISRRVRFGNKYRNTETRILSPRKKGKYNPYLTIILYDKNHKNKTFHMHRLVALHFVDGYFDGAEVNHKDGCKQNNIYTNLEWCTRSDNIFHSYHTLGMNRMKGKAILQLTMDGKPICFYQSGVEASKVTGVCKSCITDCALGKLNHAGNFKWQYF